VGSEENSQSARHIFVVIDDQDFFLIHERP
jgi:hypothetical protein